VASAIYMRRHLSYFAVSFLLCESIRDRSNTISGVYRRDWRARLNCIFAGMRATANYRRYDETFCRRQRSRASSCADTYRRMQRRYITRGVGDALCESELEKSIKHCHVTPVRTRRAGGAAVAVEDAIGRRDCLAINSSVLRRP